MAFSERLSALDASFLEIEEPGSHMHVGAVLVLDAVPLRDSEGRLAFDRIAAMVEARIHDFPRYRQRIARIPVEDHPAWVDDPDWNLQYHLRHTSLPKPGDLRQLKRLAGRIMSQQLDRGKPLWEMWIVEGLEGDRFAVIAKVHHCMIDGVSGVDLIAALLRPTPDSPVEVAPE
ncbi:MAG: wax ester/triacylglycerol synthase family O-acyltransferase, partial [Myxococcales bacterium]|nr:wax ester/triacylglycerol synthase family O-acyltransferase [Myxococcales bacterium]